MKRSFISVFACTLGVAALSLAGCKKDVAVPDDTSTGKFTLHFENTVGAAPLVLNTTSYKNANGDDFTVSTFKYYISNVKLNKADNTSYAVPNSYFLVDQADADSQDLTMAGVPVGDYSSITYTIGVDSTRSKDAVSTFTGVLNGDKGMLWTMNGPEFINMKLEGRSPQSPSTGLIFHLAGYKGANGANNTIRTITLPFPTGVNLLIRADHSPEIHTQADVAKMFTGPNPVTTPAAPFQNPVNFAVIYNKMSGPPVSKLADNVATGMFSIEHIHAN